MKFELLSEKHSKQVKALFANSEISKYLDIAEFRNDLDLLFGSFMHAVCTGAGRYYVAFDSNEIAGFIGIHHINFFHRFGNLTIVKNPMLKICMKDFLFSVLTYEYQNYQINRIEAQVHVNNVKAQSFFEQCGFKKEGVMRENFRVGTILCDSLLYSLLKVEFNAR